jgi:hypothetical protein
MKGADMQVAERAEPVAKVAEKSGVDQHMVAELRAKMLEGRASIPTFALAIDKTERTVRTYVAQGMPCDSIGQTPYVIAEPAIRWLRNRRHRNQEPRPRGRPRKSNAV